MADSWPEGAASVLYLLDLLLQPGTVHDCTLTGLCGAPPPRVGPHAGLMYLALGFVVAGVFGLWRELRRPTPKSDGETTT